MIGTQLVPHESVIHFSKCTCCGYSYSYSYSTKNCYYIPPTPQYTTRTLGIARPTNGQKGESLLFLPTSILAPPTQELSHLPNLCSNDQSHHRIQLVCSYSHRHCLQLRRRRRQSFINRRVSKSCWDTGAGIMIFVATRCTVISRRAPTDCSSTCSVEFCTCEFLLQNLERNLLECELIRCAKGDPLRDFAVSHKASIFPAEKEFARER